MIKTVKIAFLYIFISSGIHADNDMSISKGFLGLEVGASMMQGDTFSEPRHEGTAADFGVRLGAQSDEYRATFAFNYMNSDDDDQNIEKLSLSVDYFFAEKNLDLMVKPFIGANVGYANYESTGIDVSDFVYGGQVGVMFPITREIDLDLSYRYSLSNSDALNSTGSLTFGFNYLY